MYLIDLIWANRKQKLLNPYAYMSQKYAYDSKQFMNGKWIWRKMVLWTFKFFYQLIYWNNIPVYMKQPAANAVKQYFDKNKTKFSKQLRTPTFCFNLEVSNKGKFSILTKWNVLKINCNAICFLEKNYEFEEQTKIRMLFTSLHAEV